MKLHGLRAMGLTVLLLGLATQRSWGQEGGRNTLHSFNGPNNMYGPECAGTPQKHCWYPGRYVLCDPMNRPSVIRCLVPPECNCCWASPDTLGVGNLKTDLLFAFSSSRRFFHEPCLNGRRRPRRSGTARACPSGRRRIAS